MAAYCVSSPTLTTSGVDTTRSVSTTTSRYVTTPPGSVITTFVRTCSTVANSAICGTSTRVVTQTGTPFTTQGQVAVTVDVPYTYRTTLYGSSCTSVPGDAVVSTTTRSITPVVSTVTSSSAYTSDGTTYITLVTSLSSALPAQSTDASPSSPSNTKIPAIVGGAFGGLVVLALLTIVVWKFLKKPRVSFDKEDYTKFNHSEQGSVPYHYTPVGQQEGQIVAQAYPNDAGPQPAYYGNDTPTFNGVAGGDSFTQYATATSNVLGPTATGNETGLQPLTSNEMYNVPNHGPVHQIPIPSLTPLVAGSAAIAGAGLASRPNTTLSSTPYMSGSHPTVQQMNYPPNVGYIPQQYPSHPALLAPFPQPQPYGPPPPLQGQGQRPPSHNLSVGSTMSMPTSSGAIGSSTGRSVDLMPSVIHPGQVYPQLQQPFVQQPYPNSLSESQSIGSTGPLDGQVLQVMNPGSDTFIQDSSSTTFNTPGLVVGPSSSTSSPPPIDGKGRPVDTQGEKAPTVHLDAGAYGESSTSAPPAYRE